MNLPSGCRFPRLPLAKVDAGANLGARFLRAKGPAPCQPRATPWVIRREYHPSPEGAALPVRRRPMDRPFRANLGVMPKPRASPRAGMVRTVGAEESQRDYLIFRATQAGDKLRREKITGKDTANQAHREVGAKVRQAIKELESKARKALKKPKQ